LKSGVSLKYIKQFFIIILVSFIGEILNLLIPLPIPASIYGIVLMFLALEFKIIPIESVKETGKFLIEIMPIMFVPAAVGLIDSWVILKPSILEYAVITVVTTFVVMAVSGLVTQALMKKKGEQSNE
jgi:holin-like protein